MCVYTRVYVCMSIYMYMIVLKALLQGGAL